MVGWALRVGGCAARMGLATAGRSGLLLRPAVAPVASPRLSRASVVTHDGAPTMAAVADLRQRLCSSAPTQSTTVAEVAAPPLAAASSSGIPDGTAAPDAADVNESGTPAAVPAGGEAPGAAAPASSSSSTTAVRASAGASVGLGAEFVSRLPGRSLEGSSSLVSVASSVSDAALLDGPRATSEAMRLEKEIGKLMTDSRIHQVVSSMVETIRVGAVAPTRRTFIMALSAANRISWATAAVTIFEASRKAGVAFGLQDYNNLLRTLSRVGAVDRMRAVIDDMWAAGEGAAPDTRSYDQLVTALAVSRSHTVKDALDVTDEMRARGVMPSVGTYERFVAACVSANKIRMATATLAAMNNQGVSANARTYAVVLAAAANANLSNEVVKLLPLALAALEPYAAYLRRGPATSPRYRKVPARSSNTNAGAGIGNETDASTSRESSTGIHLRKPRLEVGVLIAAMAAAARTEHVDLANQVWQLIRSATYTDWTPSVSVVQALLNARAGAGDIVAAFDAIDEMVALGHDATAVRCRRLINLLSRSPQTLDDAWYLLLARKAAAASGEVPTAASVDASDGDMAARAAADTEDAIEETPTADANDATTDGESFTADDAADSSSMMDATDNTDADADASPSSLSSVGTGVVGGSGMPSMPTTAHLNVLLRACALAGDSVRAKQTLDAAEEELGVVPDAFSYVALSRAQLSDRNSQASMATLDFIAAAGDTIPRVADAADEALTQRVLLLKLNDRLADAVAVLRESVNATVAALSAVDAGSAEGGDGNSDSESASAAAAAARRASSLPFKFLARRARQVNDSDTEAEVLRLAAVAGFDPADVKSYTERQPRARARRGDWGRGGEDSFRGGGVTADPNAAIGICTSRATRMAEGARGGVARRMFMGGAGAGG
ncbi:hypothetical protein MMPV_004932 [Pyropia vietnamensis]